MKKIILLFCLFIIFDFAIFAEDDQKTIAKIKTCFTPEFIKAFQEIPILSEGRVKPINTYASFLLLKFNGKRNTKDLSGKTILPMEWFLTTLFYPEISAKYKVFLIDNTDILSIYGFKSNELRDRFSFEELAPYIQDIFSGAERIQQKDSKKTSLEEKQLLALATNLFDFIKIIKTLNFAKPMQEESSIGLELNKPPRFIIAQMIELKNKAFQNDALKNFPEEKQKIVLDEFDKISKQAIETFRHADWFTIFPPLSASNKEWLSPFDLFISESPNTNIMDINAILTAWEDISTAVENQKETPELFLQLSSTILKEIYKNPNAKMQQVKIKTENSYYKLDLIYWGLILFVIAFHSICISTVTNSIVWQNINRGLLYIPIIMLISAICMRCFILERPPVATLYESVLFITVVICFVCAIAEILFKSQIPTIVSSVIGSIGLFTSYRYEMGDGTDTMGNLAAVLNSNFWLATHVTTVTIGYSAGLLASAYAHLYVLAKVFRLPVQDSFYKVISKLIYGTICFCTLFATIGTILGGIWANDSWGRFWGWDPKENGALAIVLWNLIILHGRLGGIFKEFQIIILSIIGGMVVVASWWGVNQLGVGLHSYGFTDGIVKNLIIFGVIELVVIAIAYFHRFFIENNLKTNQP